MTAGHPEKSLLQKLGYQADQTVYTPTSPEWFSTYLRSEDVHLAHHLPANWAHLFITKQAALRHWLERQPLNSISHGLWISWPKQASKQPTDITEQTLRDIILPLGWVDVKVCAIDAVWSGLKFVPRRTQA